MEKRSGLSPPGRSIPLENGAVRSDNACRMLSRNASALLRPAVAESESNSGRTRAPSLSRTRFFAEFAQDSGSYGFGGITFGYFSEFLAGCIDFRCLDQMFHILEVNAML